MEPVVKILKRHTIEPSLPNERVTFVQSEEQYSLANGGQAVLTEMRRFADIYGEAITDKSELAYSEIVDGFVHVGSCHRCLECWRICPLPTLKKRVCATTLAEAPVDAAPPVLGFCSECWGKVPVRLRYYGKASLRLLRGMSSLVIRPLRALDGEEGPPDSPRQPAPVIVLSPEPPPATPPPTDGEKSTPSQQRRRVKPGVAPTVAALIIGTLMAFSSGTAAGRVEINPCGEVAAMAEDVHESGDDAKRILALTAKALEDAKKLGLDLPMAAEVPRGLCIILKAFLEKGQPDLLRLRMLQAQIEKRIAEVDECALLFDTPEPEEIADGDLEFMTTYPTGHAVRRPHESLALGFQIFGNTGSGKSTLIYRAVESWLSLKLPAIIVALKPDGLFSSLERSFDNRLLWFKAGVERFYNAFSAPCGGAIQFIREKLEYWQSCYQKWDSATILAHVLEQFDKDRHLHRQPAPTLQWLLDALPGMKLSRDLFNPALKPSVHGTLYLMNKGLLGATMNCPSSLNLHAVMDDRLAVLVELHGLSDADYHFFVACLLADLRAIREQHPSLPPILFVADEADALVSERWDKYPHIGAVSAEVPLCRSAGIHFVFAAHNPSRSHPQVRSNSGMTLVSALSSADDISASGTSAAIAPNHQYNIALLPPFVGILKITGSGYRSPFLVQWKPLSGLRPLTEQERIETNSRILSAYPELLPQTQRKGGIPLVAAHTSQDDESIVLQDLGSRPYMAVTERASTLKLSEGAQPDYERLAQVLATLHGRGYCVPMKVRMVEGRGANSLYWILTPKGFQTTGVAPFSSRPGTGYQHAWAQHFLKHLLGKRGVDSEIEPRRGESQPDLGFLHGRKPECVAVEVVFSTHKYEYSKIRGTLAEWDRLLMVCLTVDDRNRLDKYVVDGFRNDGLTPYQRVRICLPHHLLEPDLSSVFCCPDLVFSRVKQKHT